MPDLTPGEQAALEQISQRITGLRDYLTTERGGSNLDPEALFHSVAKIKDIQSSIDDDMSLLACLMAKRYLLERFHISHFDAAENARDAQGLNVDVTTDEGERIIAEIKTTGPYDMHGYDLGAQQKESFRKDFVRLTRTSANHKYLFLTDLEAYRIVQNRYISELPGVQVVLLTSGTPS